MPLLLHCNFLIYIFKLINMEHVMKISNAIKRFSRQLVFATSLFALPFSALAAVDMFLQIEGVDGESRDATYTGWIEVLAFSEGMTQSGTTHVGAGGSAGRVNVLDLTVTKFLDRSSPFIRQRVAEGRPIPKATLVVRKAGADPLVIFKIEIQDIIISSVSMNASGSDDRLTENVTLNFARIQWVYTPQLADGSPDAEIPAGWDIQLNQKI